MDTSWYCPNQEVFTFTEVGMTLPRSTQKGGPRESHPQIRLVESPKAFKAARMFQNMLSMRGLTAKQVKAVRAFEEHLRDIGINMEYYPLVLDEAEKLQEVTEVSDRREKRQPRGI